MDNEKGEKRMFSFSRTRGYICFGNNLGTITIVTFLVVIICTYKGNLDRLVSLYGILLLFMMYGLTEYLMRKFAYKIVIDMESRQIQFYMFRHRDVITINFDDIIKIKINAYVTFSLNRGKLFYNGELTDDFVSCLNKVKVIHWGILRKILS